MGCRESYVRYFVDNSNAEIRRSQDWESGSVDLILTSDAQSSCEQTLLSRPQFHPL